MKSNKNAKTKTRSKSKTHKKTTAPTHVRQKTEASPTMLEPSPSLTFNTSLKTCQELEVGDIGGFGSTKELEEHQKRCSEPATEFCTNCGRNLCRNHYEMIHRDHDRSLGGTNTATLA